MPGNDAAPARWPQVPLRLFLERDVNVRMSWEAIDRRLGICVGHGSITDPNAALPEIPCPHPGCKSRFHPIDIALHVAREGPGTSLLRCTNSTRWGPLRLRCPGALRVRVEVNGRQPTERPAPGRSMPWEIGGR